MEIGTTRFVLVIPFLGIVLKFPIIRVFTCLGILTEPFRYKVMVFSDLEDFLDFYKLVLRIATRGDYRHMGTFSNNLFSGIVANKLESKIWHRYKPTCCQKTFFSLFGLITVQRYGEPVQKNSGLIGHWYDSSSNHRIISLDSHTLSEEKNYSVSASGYVVLHDYGSLRLAHTILRWGDEFSKRVNA